MNKPMGKLLLSILLSLLLLGCGVRPRELGSGTQGGSNGVPAGAVLTKNGKFYFRVSSTDYQVGEVTITYNLVTTELELVGKEHSFLVKYWMPEMPTMPVTPPKLDASDIGKLRVVYDISMGGLWEFEITITRGGVAIDSFGYKVTVPE